MQDIVSVNYRTVKVFRLQEAAVLPAGKNVSELICATVPVDPEDIGSTNEACKVVEIDFIDCLVLIICKIQLVGHLIGEEERLLAGSCGGHCACLKNCGREKRNCCDEKLFHGY